MNSAREDKRFWKAYMALHSKRCMYCHKKTVPGSSRCEVHEFYPVKDKHE